MTIKEQFAKAFNVTTTGNNIQSYRRIQGGSTTTTTSHGINSTASGTNTIGYPPGTSVWGGTAQFGQPSFGASSVSTANRPVMPFQLLSELEQAIIVKQFLIEKGVNTINKETANALGLVSCVLKDQVLPPVKQAKKKLII